MKDPARFILPLVLVLAVFGAGCSALPGLRVLTGEVAPEAAAERVVEVTGLVMADKSGTTDPSLLAAADRIEAAGSGRIDIIEIRQNSNSDTFDIYMLYQGIGGNADAQTENDALRRALELAWQGTLQASQGSDMIRVSMLQPSMIPTLDKGPSFIARIAVTFEIAREDVVSYLAMRPTTLQDFINLIADGQMTYTSPEDGVDSYYNSQPNHPMFMLASMEAELNAQAGQ